MQAILPRATSRRGLTSYHLELIYGALLVILSVAAWFGWVRTLTPALHAPFVVPWWAIGAVTFVVYRWTIQIPLGKHSTGLGLDHIPLMLGLYFSTSAELLVGISAGIVVADLSRGVRSVRGVTCNVGFTFAGYLPAIAIFGITVPGGDPMGWRGWMASLLAMIAFTLSNDIASVVGLWIKDGRVIPLRTVAIARAAGAYVIPISAGLALLIVDLLWFDAKGTVLLLSPGVAIVIAFRSFEAERHQRHAIDLLTGIGGALSVAGGLEPAVLGVLSQARSMFRVEFAQLTIFPVGGGDKAFRSTVRVHGAEEVMAPIDMSGIDSLLLPNDTDGMVMNRATTNRTLRDLLSTHNVDDAMVAMLCSETNVIGTVMVGGHTDPTDSAFSDKELRVFVTLAQQTSKALEASQLEEAVNNLTERQTELSYKAFHDPLTGLGNRILFIDRSELATRRQARTSSSIAILYIDLDDFKAANDTFGHGMGDQLLIAVARRLEASIRQSDTAARLGGDEFALLLEDFDSVDAAVEVAERVVAALKEPVVFGDAVLSSQASVGLAVAGPPGIPAPALTQNADTAMYVAKRRGKGRMVLYQDTMESIDEANEAPPARPRVVAE